MLAAKRWAAMDLVCPNCQQRLSIEDRYGGTVVKCPSCAGMLQAPVLPTTPMAAPAPALPEAQPVSAPPSVPSVAAAGTAGASASPPPAAEPAVPSIALPPGPYTRRIRWHLRPDVLE